MWRRLSAVFLTSVLTCAPAAARTPVPTYWDSVSRKRGYWIDVKTITSIRLLKCKETDNPSKVICETEVEFQAVRYTRPTEEESTVKFPKEKIEDEQEKPK